MVKDAIVETYWYVFNNGKRWITQGGKPVPGPFGGFLRSGDGMKWLCLDGADAVLKDEVMLTNDDFKDVDFPDVEPDTPVEIEIVKSGRVYVYES